MEAITTIKSFVSKFVKVPPTQWVHLLPLFKIRKLKKGDCFATQGEPAEHLAIVIKGLLYNYYTNEDGKMFVMYFVKEKEVVGCYRSLIQNIPATFTSQCLEPTTLATIKYQDLLDLYKRHPAWERMGRHGAETQFCLKDQREQQFMMADAKTRYENFAKSHPDLLTRLPQYLIASYIGISPVSLSRIRTS